MKLTEAEVLEAILENRISMKEAAYLVEIGRNLGKKSAAAALMAALALGNAHALPKSDAPLDPSEFDSTEISSFENEDDLYGDSKLDSSLKSGGSKMDFSGKGGDSKLSSKYGSSKIDHSGKEGSSKIASKQGSSKMDYSGKGGSSKIASKYGSSDKTPNTEKDGSSKVR